MHVTSRGFTIDYRCNQDRGPCFLLIHGMLQAGEDWITYRYPEELSPYRVIAVDQLGFGLSDKPHDATVYGLDNQVVDLVAVLDAEGVDRAVIWGYSLGCFAAEAFARQMPDRTIGLVLGGNLVGLSPVDRGNIVAGSAAGLAEKGVAGYCEENLPFLDQTTRQLFATRNDPIAAGLACEAQASPHTGEGAALPSTVFNYAGSHEPWIDVGAAVAEVHNVTFRSIDGADHGQAFRDSGTVVRAARDYLTPILA
jgi:pimeloyl-ACP methyl ester carboxylesterase